MLEQKVITYKELGTARQQQMIEALQEVMAAERDALMFIPGPVEMHRVEAVIHFEDVLASAFAGFRLGATEAARNESLVSNDHTAAAQPFAGDRALRVIWGHPAMALIRHSR
ncbi:hypothetical protein BH09CHL1_BH09CHL1_35690 [soil metagenome]